MRSQIPIREMDIANFSWCDMQTVIERVRNMEGLRAENYNK